ncbi:crossover junction endodeoxyribonuclease RuvC [Streptomyces sp. NPDC056255]|uniref:crossover junction endodeoxyribonuclease RuvC n=1 Tax=Streptomyces sp. NPDC056255 TaxID=3345764 RepID=UPI0035DC15B2
MTAVPGLIAPGALSPVADLVAAPGGLRVIGLDLSLTSTGVALPDGTTYRIKTRSKDGDRRLLVIRRSIREALAAHRPHVAVVEDLPTHAKGAGITANVHGVVKCELLDAGVPYGFVVPATLKKFASDNGNADKPEMAAAAYLAAGVEFPGDLTPSGKGGDMCDAWWLRAAGHDALGQPLFGMPQAQRDRLRKIEWPEAILQRYSVGAAA